MTNPFKNELTYIEGDLYKEIMLRAMRFIPRYFWVVPASTSGRYHPQTSLGEGGLFRHTQSVFRVAQELLGHPLYREMFTSEERDMTRIACLLHDACKQGVEDIEDGYTDDHPILVRDALYPWRDGLDKPEGMEEAWSNISDLIDTHMCVWNTRKDGTEFAPIPTSNLQLFVHMADYLASRRGIEMEPLGEYKPDWKQDLASEAQVKYIESLLDKCKEAGINDLVITTRDSEGVIILKKGNASNVIGRLKKSLG